VVDDVNASGGKTLNVPSEGVSNWNVVMASMPQALTTGRYRYKTRETGNVKVTIENLSAATRKCEVRLFLQHDLLPAHPLGAKQPALDPLTRGNVEFPLNHGGGEFGYAVRAALVIDSGCK